MHKALHYVSRCINGEWRRYVDTMTDEQLENAFVKQGGVPEGWRIYHVPVRELQLGSPRVNAIRNMPIMFSSKPNGGKVGICASLAKDIEHDLGRSIGESE